MLGDTPQLIYPHKTLPHGLLHGLLHVQSGLLAVYFITKVIIFYEILLLFSLLCCSFIYYALPVNSRLKNSQKMSSLSTIVRF